MNYSSDNGIENENGEDSREDDSDEWLLVIMYSLLSTSDKSSFV